MPWSLARLDLGALKPREHGLWGWVAIPWIAVVARTPSAGIVATAACVGCGFLTVNAWARGLRSRGRMAPSGFLAAGGAVLAGIGGLAASERPALLAVVLGGGGALALGAVAGFRGRLPHSKAFEIAGIFGLCALAGVGAWAQSVHPSGVMGPVVGSAAWLVCGLWWVHRTLVVPHLGRPPWSGGTWVAMGVVAVSAAAAIALYDPGALVPLAYPLRLLHRRPDSVRDARRVGLTELAWGVLAALAIGLTGR